MTSLEDAIQGLRQALNNPRRYHMWRWLVRHRMAGVKEALSREYSHPDGWLAARSQALGRERDTLVRRLSELGPEVLEAADVEPVRGELHRLVTDLEHHRQRLSDLTYDSVALELGGSE